MIYWVAMNREQLKIVKMALYMQKHLAEKNADKITIVLLEQKISKIVSAYQDAPVIWIDACKSQLGTIVDALHMLKCSDAKDSDRHMALTMLQEINKIVMSQGGWYGEGKCESR